MADIPMDRHYKILHGILMDQPPLEDETPDETALRVQLEKEVAEIVARGQIPSIPYD